MSYEKVFLPRLDLLSSAGPDAITEFGDRSDRNLVVVPETYLFDLEGIVKSDHVQARGARDALKYVTEAITRSGSFEDKDTRFSEPTPVGETLDISIARDTLRGRTIDDVVELARAAQTQFATSPTVITMSDAEMGSLKLRGIAVEKPRFLTVSADIVKGGLIEGPDELLTALYENDGSVPLDLAREIMGVSEHAIRTNQMLFPNQFISFENPADERNHGVAYAKVTPLTRRNKEGHIFERERNVSLLDLGGRSRRGIYNVKPRSGDQFLALEHLLLNDDITLVFITGGHGSGKTLLSYVAALDGIDTRKGKEKNHGRYDRIVVFKPNDPMGGGDRTLGFEPGDRGQKTRSIIASFGDAHNATDLRFSFELMLEGTIESDFDPTYRKKKIDEGQLRAGARGYFPVEISPITNPWSANVRGRTFTNSFMLIDEGQMYSPYEARTLFERAGRGTKIVVMGDPFQLDSTNSQNTVEINGLTSAIRHYQGQPYFGLIHLEGNFRNQASDNARTWRTY